MSHRHDHALHVPHDHDGLAVVLDLDAEVLAEPLLVVQDEIAALVDGPVRSILDVGAGTGTGTFTLLQHLPEARAVAVDASAEMLAHLRDRAVARGLGDRVTTRQADLDDGVPDVEPVDLVWASASLHHLADPDRTLMELVDVVRPGGLLVAVELSGHPRFLPAGASGASAEDRAHALVAADRDADMPTMGDDWGPRLTRAGLLVEVERSIPIDLASPPPRTGEYAAAVLSRIRGAVAERLEPDDLAAFDALLDGGPGDVRRRSDLHVRTERQLWVARRTRTQVR